MTFKSTLSPFDYRLVLQRQQRPRIRLVSSMWAPPRILAITCPWTSVGNMLKSICLV